MAIDQEEVRAAKNILWPDEKVEMTVRQRRIGPGGSITTPTTVITTDKRLIILNRTSLGFRKDYEVIPYRQIASVSLENGVISSSVFIRMQGYDRDTGPNDSGKEEGEINGLRSDEARALADYLSRRIEQISVAGETGTGGMGGTERGMGADVYCSKCGTKNDKSAKFCSKCGARLS